MMLLVDIGNSRVKLGWLDRGVRESEPLAVAHDQWHAIHTWRQGLPHAPVAAIGVNVAGAQLGQQLEDALGLPMRWLAGGTCAAGVRNAYTTPEQLGADRWLALIGLATHAVHDPETPLMLANYGTATTIDTLTPQHQDGTRCFIGGLILPGVNLMRSALAQHTAQLPLAQGAVTAFPIDTDAAIVSGVCAAQAGALVRQWRHVLAHFGRAPAVYVSGGNWHWVADAVQDAMTQIQTDLVLTPDSVRMLRVPVLDGLARVGMEGVDMQRSSMRIQPTQPRSHAVR